MQLWNIPELRESLTSPSSEVIITAILRITRYDTQRISYSAWAACALIGTYNCVEFGTRCNPKNRVVSVTYLVAQN